MKQITYFRRSSGLIVGTNAVKEGREEHGLPADLDWLEGAHDAGALRIDLETREPVPLLEFALTIDGGRITGIPEGTRAIVNGEGLIVDDGELLIVGDHGLEQTVAVVLQCELYAPKVLSVLCPATN